MLLCRSIDLLCFVANGDKTDTKDKTVLHQAAILYQKIGNTEKAKEYLGKALQAGLTESEVDSSLK